MIEIFLESAEFRRVCYFIGFIFLVDAIASLINAIAALVK